MLLPSHAGFMLIFHHCGHCKRPLGMLHSKPQPDSGCLVPERRRSASASTCTAGLADHMYLGSIGAHPSASITATSTQSAAHCAIRAPKKLLSGPEKIHVVYRKQLIVNYYGKFWNSDNILWRPIAGSPGSSVTLAVHPGARPRPNLHSLYIP